MMYSLWKTSAYLLMLGLVSAMEILMSSNHVLHTASCPEVGYFHHVGTPLPEGPCYLCFCRLSNNTAVCQETAKNLCDDRLRVVEDLASSGNKRMRRSPVSFRETRNHFYKPLPKHCKPFESSFSDGCPPADWCVGCKVCECDANAQWNCHILSFCDGAASNNKLHGKPKNMPKRRGYYPNKPTPTPKNKVKSKKVVKKPIPKLKIRPNTNVNAKKRMNNNKKPNNNAKKTNNNVRKRTNQSKRATVNAKKSNIKKGNKPKQRPPPQKKPTTRKPHSKRLMVKKLMRTTKKQQTKKPQPAVKKNLNLQSKADELVLERKIFKHAMSTVQRMLSEHLKKLQNTTRVKRSINSKNKKDRSEHEQNKAEKINRLNYYNLRINKFKNYSQSYNIRKKRKALDLDLSIIELNDANLKDYHAKDLSVKRFIKNVTKFGFGNSNITKNYMIDISTENNVLGNSTTETSSTKSTDNMALNSTETNQYYKYSIDINSSNVSFTTELAITEDETNNTSMVLKFMGTDEPKNITGRNTERAKQYAIIMSDPEFHDVQNKKWERMQILRDNIIKTNQATMFNKAKQPINDSNIDKYMIKRWKNKIRRKNIRRKLDVPNKHNLKKIISNNFKTVSSNYFGTPLTPSNNSSNISSLHILLENLMKELNRNTTTSLQLKTKFSLLKHLRNIFKNIFSKKKGNHLKGHKTNEGMTLEILCQNIGACFLNKHNRIALRYKIHDLNAETEEIFKSIKIIKGLLFLIKMPMNIENTTRKPLNHEMQKLDAILRGNYGENMNLTETQATQISCVKKTIHQFIKSVGRFATILYEVVDVLYKNNKKYSCQRNSRLFHKKKEQNSFNRIKKLLVKYNIVQNTFMKKMYQLLTDVEKNMTTENSKPKVSVGDLNKTQVIDKYSKNIIQNLRKLRNLAQALNSSRRKRQTMREDDAIEYLLLLMEYLLKPNHPLDTAPVNDGIDLLIEAIQNAPHIKPIKKKVLDELPTTHTPTRTTNVDVVYKEDTISDSNIISKEENNPSKTENNVDREEIVDNEEEITQNVYYKRFDDNDNTTVYNDYYTTEYAVKTTSEKEEKEETGEKTGFDRFENAIHDTRRYEVFTSDLEEEPIIPIVINTTEKQEPTTVTTKFEESTIVPIRDYKLDEDSAPEKKSKLDWIEENFGKEIREFREDNVSDAESTVVLPAYTTQAATTVKPKDQNVDNISSLTVELEDEKKKKRSKAAADEVLYRKQIEFLNLLDYGTERSELDESELKDDEKYANDGFPSYFVRYE